MSIKTGSGIGGERVTASVGVCLGGGGGMIGMGVRWFSPYNIVTFAMSNPY